MGLGHVRVWRRTRIMQKNVSTYTCEPRTTEDEVDWLLLLAWWCDSILFNRVPAQARATWNKVGLLLLYSIVVCVLPLRCTHQRSCSRTCRSLTFPSVMDSAYFLAPLSTHRSAPTVATLPPSAWASSVRGAWRLRSPCSSSTSSWPVVHATSDVEILLVDASQHCAVLCARLLFCPLLGLLSVSAVGFALFSRCWVCSLSPL